MKTTRRAILKLSMSGLLASTSVPTLGATRGGQPSGGDGDRSLAWRTLRVGGGGYIRGVDAVGTDLLARSDTHPALYRFDTAENEWVPLITSYSLPPSYVSSYGRSPASGVWEARICPSVQTKYYMIYCNVPFVSTDSGRSWRLANGTGWPLVTDADANSGTAQTNHKLAIDPANDAIVYIGTPKNGLQKTTNSGVSWSNVSGVEASRSHGIAIAFDPTSSVRQKVTQGIFAVSQGHGVWRSSDGGTTWVKLDTTHMPTAWVNVTVDQNGKLWICGGGTNQLTSWTPREGWVENALTDDPAALAVDPTNANNIICCSEGGRFYISTNGGVSWTDKIITTKVIGSGDALWQAWGPTAGYSGGGRGYSPGSYGLSASNIAFDSSGSVYFGWGFGVWKAASSSVFESPDSITWNAFSRGIESLDATSIIHPPGGNPVGTAWDLMIWNFPDYGESYPSSYGPDDDFNGPMPNYGVNLVRGLMLDYSSGDPSFLVALTTVGGYYSSNKGANWTKFRVASGEDAFARVYQGGCIASSTTTNHIAMCFGTGISYTVDNGRNWARSKYAGNGYTNFPFFYSSFVAADRVTANKFYALSHHDGFYVSIDSGATFNKVSNFTSGTGLSRLKAVPGHAGHVFFVVGNSLNPQPITSAVLIWTTNSCSSFRKLSDFVSVEDVGFGTIVLGQSYPTLYIAAYRISTRIYGVYKCPNFDPNTGSGTWTLLANADGTNYPEGWFAAISGVAGDPNLEGRCSISYTNGGFKRYG